MPSLTPADFTVAIKDKYTESVELSTGYLVLNEDGEVVRWSVGVSRIFGTTEEEMLEAKSGERVRDISDFFGPGMTKERHKLLVRKEFDLIKQALGSKELYTGGFMGSTGGKIRYVEGKDVDGQAVSFGIEFCPLFIEKLIFIVAFVTRNPQSVQQESAIVAKAEVSAVMENARLKFLDQSTNLAGSKFLGIYDFFYNRVFHKSPEVYRGPLSYLFSAVTVVALLGSLGTIAFYIWGPKPEFRNYNFDRPEPVSPNGVQTGSPNRNSSPGQ